MVKSPMVLTSPIAPGFQSSQMVILFLHVLHEFPRGIGRKCLGASATAATEALGAASGCAAPSRDIFPCSVVASGSQRHWGHSCVLENTTDSPGELVESAVFSLEVWISG